jgi:hypothetical protein
MKAGEAWVSKADGLAGGAPCKDTPDCRTNSQGNSPALVIDAEPP